MLDLFFRKYAWTANLALLFAAAWLSAKTVNTVVAWAIRPRPQAELAAPPPTLPRPTLPVALDEARLYHLIGVEPPRQETAAADAAPQRPQNCQDPRAEPVRSDLRLQLVATVLSDIPRQSLATFVDGSSRVVVGVGDTLPGSRAELLALQRVRTDEERMDFSGNAFRVVAIVCNEGTKEYVDFDAGGGEAIASGPNVGVAPVPPGPARPGAAMEGIRPVGKDKYEIERSVLDSSLNNLNPLLTQARVTPFFENGATTGFKVFSIQPGSLYASIGIENGDVVQRINGYEINSPEKALELYQKLRDTGHVTLQLKRGGTVVTKEYSITGQ